MIDCENLIAEYKYNLNELTSFVKVLLTAAEQENTILTQEDIEHNIEMVYEKLVRLNDQITIIKKHYIIINLLVK